MRTSIGAPLPSAQVSSLSLVYCKRHANPENVGTLYSYTSNILFIIAQSASYGATPGDRCDKTHSWAHITYYYYYIGAVDY